MGGKAPLFQRPCTYNQIGVFTQYKIGNYFCVIHRVIYKHFNNCIDDVNLSKLNDHSFELMKQGTVLSNFVKVRLRYKCYPVNLMDVFRTRFYKNTYGGLLLIIVCPQYMQPPWDCKKWFHLSNVTCPIFGKTGQL